MEEMAVFWLVLLQVEATCCSSSLQLFFLLRENLEHAAVSVYAVNMKTGEIIALAIKA